MENDKPKHFSLQSLFSILAVLIGICYIFCGGAIVVISITGNMNHLMGGILAAGVGLGIIMSFICISMMAGVIIQLGILIGLYNKNLANRNAKERLSESLDKMLDMFSGSKAMKFTLSEEEEVKEFESLEDLYDYQASKKKELNELSQDELKTRLKTAITSEDYVQASAIRDELKRREEKK